MYQIHIQNNEILSTNIKGCDTNTYIDTVFNYDDSDTIKDSFKWNRQSNEYNDTIRENKML